MHALGQSDIKQQRNLTLSLNHSQVILVELWLTESASHLVENKNSLNFHLEGFEVALKHLQV